jgi:hypothetical protein
MGQPSYYKVAVWAAFDILEKTLYTAVTNARVPLGESITPLDVTELLKVVSCKTPMGRVAFDSNRINTATISIFTQQKPARQTQVAIVGPSGVATSPFVYPMPSWDDRIYKW